MLNVFVTVEVQLRNYNKTHGSVISRLSLYTNSPPPLFFLCLKLLRSLIFKQNADMERPPPVLAPASASEVCLSSQQFAPIRTTSMCNCYFILNIFFKLK